MTDPTSLHPPFRWIWILLRSFWDVGQVKGNATWQLTCAGTRAALKQLQMYGTEKVQHRRHNFPLSTTALPTNYIIGHICILWCHYTCCCSSLRLWWLCSSGMKHVAFWQYWFPKIKASHWPLATCFFLHCSVLHWDMVSVLAGPFHDGIQRSSE